MARQVYRARISIKDVGGEIRPAGFRLARIRAMASFAPVLQRAVREEASRRVQGGPSLTNRGQRRYRDRMEERYTAEPVSGGDEISVTANTLRGRIFELGARAHPITPRRGNLLYWRSPKPNGALYSKARIERHPGQRANPVMGDTIRDMADVGERMLYREIGRAM